MRRTTRALRECMEWLAACLALGWPKNDLDALEAIWWQHHDHTGKPAYRVPPSLDELQQYEGPHD